MNFGAKQARDIFHLSTWTATPSQWSEIFSEKTSNPVYLFVTEVVRKNLAGSRQGSYANLLLLVLLSHKCRTLVCIFWSRAYVHTRQ